MMTSFSGVSGMDCVGSLVIVAAAAAGGFFSGSSLGAALPKILGRSRKASRLGSPTLRNGVAG